VIRAGKYEYDQKSYRKILFNLYTAKVEVDGNMMDDRSNYLQLQKKVNLFPYEGYAHRVLNDITFFGLDAHMTCAFEYLCSARPVKHDSLYKPKTHDGDDNSITQKLLDICPAVGRGLVSVSYEMRHLGRIMVGGVDYKDKLTERTNEKRSSVWADLDDPGNYKDESALPDAMTTQDHRFMEVANDTRYDLVGGIVSMHFLPKLVRTGKVLFALPAPYPASLSVYAVYCRSLTRGAMTLDTVQDLAALRVAQMNYSLTAYNEGLVGSRQIDLIKSSPNKNDLLSVPYLYWHDTVLEPLRNPMHPGYYNKEFKRLLIKKVSTEKSRRIGIEASRFTDTMNMFKKKKTGKK